MFYGLVIKMYRTSNNGESVSFVGYEGQFGSNDLSGYTLRTFYQNTEDILLSGLICTKFSLSINFESMIYSELLPFFFKMTFERMTHGIVITVPFF